MRLHSIQPPLWDVLSICLSLALLGASPLARATLICDFCPDPNRFTYPGIGFNLALDYGTSVVYFPNGTAVAVARIEGSAAYKSGMRMTDSDEPGASSVPPPQRSHTPRPSASLTQFARKVINWWPRTPHVSPYRSMLHSLKVATEAYLETTLNTTEFAIPEALSARQQERLKFAFDAEGLRLAWETWGPAGAAASRANDIGVCATHDCAPESVDAELVLSVEYSRAALTLVMWAEDGTMYEHFRLAQDLDLGTDALGKPEESDKAYWERVRLLIKEVASTPNKEKAIFGEYPTSVSHVVLLGEHVTERRFLALLRDVVGEKLVSKAESGLDPVFAAARGTAVGSKEKIDHGPMHCEPAGHCDDSSEGGPSEEL